MLRCFEQTSCDGKVASGTQVVLHEDGFDSGLAAGLDRGGISHPPGGLLQSYTLLRSCLALIHISSAVCATVNTWHVLTRKQ